MAGVNPRRGMPTFGAVWREMNDEVDKPKLSPATIADYEDRAKRHILPGIGGKLIVTSSGRIDRALLIDINK